MKDYDDLAALAPLVGTTKTTPAPPGCSIPWLCPDPWDPWDLDEKAKESAA